MRNQGLKDTKRARSVVLLSSRLAFRTLSILAPYVAVPLAASLFRTPRRPRRSQRELGWAEGASRLVLPVGSTLVPGWSWGSGPETVLLVHGWAGRGLQLGAFAAPLAARGLRVVAYDAPAHGEAAGRRSSLPELAAAIVQVARRVGSLRAVVAHSLGAAAVLWARARGELEVKRLVAVAPPSDFDAVIARFAVLSGFGRGLVDRMRRRFETQLDLRWNDLTPAKLAGGLDRPLLVIHDRDDREVPFIEGQAIACAAPDGRLMVTAGLGHRRILNDPGVITAVAGFVAPDPGAAATVLDRYQPLAAAGSTPKTLTGRAR
jgi:pimeloyl-ACP methyl ester carboxylesterase